MPPPATWTASSSSGPRRRHHKGHGLGLFAQEPPYLVRGNRDVVRAGEVVAVEPGLYFPGRRGMRLEDVFVVSAYGARAWTSTCAA